MHSFLSKTKEEKQSKKDRGVEKGRGSNSYDFDSCWHLLLIPSVHTTGQLATNRCYYR